MVLRKVKGGFKVFSRSGRALSKHALPYRTALRQLRAVELHKHRGQTMIYSVVMTIVCLVVYATMYPLLINTISDMALTGASALIAQLIPLMILLGICLLPLRSGQPQGNQYQQ